MFSLEDCVGQMVCDKIVYCVYGAEASLYVI